MFYLFTLTGISSNRLEVQVQTQNYWAPMQQHRVAPQPAAHVLLSPTIMNTPVCVSKLQDSPHKYLSPLTTWAQALRLFGFGFPTVNGSAHFEKDGVHLAKGQSMTSRSWIHLAQELRCNTSYNPRKNYYSGQDTSYYKAGQMY